jgi:uncharacterized pyridoxal phosphate-dependent enzyme
VSDPFARYGLNRIINLSGTETARGAALVAPEVAEAVAALVPHAVDILELQSAASAVIARAYGTEAGLVTGCSAAAVSIAIAACMTGCDLARAEQLPDTFGMRDEVIVQRGHVVTWGSHVLQSIRSTGARPVEIGASTECGTYHLRHALSERTAAALYVVSHHTVQTGLIGLEAFCGTCHAAGVPVIVDAAAEPSFRDFVAAGADLVTTSAHKVFAALTAGIIAGRLDLVQACMFQEKGLGRPMKAGKEGIVGAIAGIERWMTLDHERIARELRARLDRARARLDGRPGIRVSLEPDWTSRAFDRLRLDIDPGAAGISAAGLAAALARQRPSIAVRSLYADQGFLQLDLRFVDDATADRVSERMLEVLRAPAAPDRTAMPPNPSDAALERLEAWPLTLPVEG